MPKCGNIIQFAAGKAILISLSRAGNKCRFPEISVAFLLHLPFCGNHPIMEIADAGPDGRRLAANARLGEAARKEGGKSELRRAVCRITSGRACSSTFDGKCHRKHTAPLGEVRVKRCGKSAPPAQQCTGHGKPHTEQDQIGKEPG